MYTELKRLNDKLVRCMIDGVTGCDDEVNWSSSRACSFLRSEWLVVVLNGLWFTESSFVLLARASAPSKAKVRMHLLRAKTTRDS